MLLGAAQTHLDLIFYHCFYKLSEYLYFPFLDLFQRFKKIVIETNLLISIVFLTDILR